MLGGLHRLRDSKSYLQDIHSTDLGHQIRHARQDCIDCVDDSN